jgi:hypothetical protein
MSNKEVITKAILENLPNRHPWQQLSFDQILLTWWSSLRESQSLRLTENGVMAFELADIEYYEYPLDKETASTYKKSLYTVNLGKKIKCPFYLGYKNTRPKTAYIRLYDSKIAMMVSLYGNFKDYFEALK